MSLIQPNTRGLWGGESGLINRRGPPGDGLAADLWGPNVLFRNGEIGFNILPGSAFCAFYQERTGASATTPAGIGDPVGTVHDLITGVYATATGDTARPTLEVDSDGAFFLLFDGVNDFLVTSSINMTGTNKVSVFARARTIAATGTYGIIVEHSTSTSTNNGSFLMGAPRSSTNNSFTFSSRGTTTVLIGNLQDAAPPVTRVLTGRADIAAPLLSLSQNGGVAETSASSQGTGNYGNYPMYIGSRAGIAGFAHIRLYGLTVRGASSTAAEISRAENWMARE